MQVSRISKYYINENKIWVLFTQKSLDNSFVASESFAIADACIFKISEFIYEIFIIIFRRFSRTFACLDNFWLKSARADAFVDVEN